MNLVQILVESFRSLLANRLRTGLTMLGIIIGIASVVLMLAMGDAVKIFLDRQLAVLGSNLLIVEPGSNKGAGGVRTRSAEALTLTTDDVNELDLLPELSGAAGVVQGNFQISFGTDNSNNAVLGVTPSIMKIRGWTLDQGIEINEEHVKAGSRVALIGSRIAERYFYKRQPLGLTIRLDGNPFTVIGVLNGEGRMFDGINLADLVLTPITSIPVRMERPRTVHYAIAQARAGQPILQAEREIRELLRDRHRIREDKEDDFQITNLASVSQTGAAVGAGLSIALGIISGISLLVGGIGIMNIMLVSVSERIREIGIRMAIGATPNSILVQFLCESVIICLIGGAIGTALAGIAAWAVSQSGKFAMSLSLTHILTAFIFSSVIGLFFGFYPAKRASRLRPVECLRQDS